jgi:hypothetical protein
MLIVKVAATGVIKVKKAASSTASSTTTGAATVQGKHQDANDYEQPKNGPTMFY